MSSWSYPSTPTEGGWPRLTLSCLPCCCYHPSFLLPVLGDTLGVVGSCPAVSPSHLVHPML